ncbi:MAG: YgfZ/GcvT domain-containing protein [Spongiibacteraceae bacterium]
MNSFWQHLTNSYQAAPRNPAPHLSPQHIGDERDAYICPLPQYGLLQVAGADSKTFLQGQTSCDWRDISNTQAGRGDYCNIKGRVISSFLAITPNNEHALLRMRSDICGSSLTAFKKYIVFSKAEISDASDQYVAIGIAGKNAKNLIKTHLTLPENGKLVAHSEDGINVIQLDEQQQQFECWLAPDRAITLWQALSAEACAVDSAYWEQLNIQQGIAEVSQATEDLFIPQMLDHQHIGAVSFEKGCYTGQEIVARMQYRGKLKRHLYRAFSAEALAPAQSGDAVYASDFTQSVGNLVSVISSNEGNHMLVVASDDAATNGAYLQGQESPIKLERLTP